MPRFSLLVSLFAGLVSTALPLTPAFAQATEPLRGLILTSPGVYHNYALQTPTLAAGIAEHLNIQFDVSLAEVARWKNTDYGEGYDVLIYNLCMADETDARLIANMRRQTEVLGTPTVVLHCSMHSFRNTDLWWPMTGLQSRAHEPETALPQEHASNHPVLTGIPAQWTLGEDELYLNLAFASQPLLVSRALDGSAEVTAWLHTAGTTRVFGTTLGHSDTSVADTSYQRLIANGILHVTGNLGADGLPPENLSPVRHTDGVIDQLSAPEGVTFLGAEGQRCAFRRMALAVGPCYVGCTLHPLKWNAAADACRRDCETALPATADLVTACMPGN